MGRLTRNTAILAEIETVYGTDPTPTGAANAILVSNAALNPLAANNVSRDLIRPYLGGSEQLVGTSHVEVTFDVELQNGGTAGTAPAWGPLLRACGFQENLLATPARVEYLPVSTDFESVSIYYYRDGVVRKLLGARGDVTFKMTSGARPVMSFKFLGIDGGIAAATPGAVTLTGFKTPRVVTNANSGDVTFGCTYAAGVLTGGSAVPSKGLEIALGASVQYTPMLGGESVDIVARETSMKLSLDLTAAEEVTYLGAVQAATLQGMGFLHGIGAGYQMMVFAPAVQLFNPTHEDLNGRALCAYDGRLVPFSGNDELRIIAL